MLLSGVVPLYLTNLMFAQRLVRAQHPRFGWSGPVSAAFLIIGAVSILAIALLVAGVSVEVFASDANALQKASGLQIFGTIWLALLAALPVLLVGISTLARRLPHIRNTKTTDKFGEGSMRMKVAIVVASGTLLSVGAWYHAVTTLRYPPTRLQAHGSDKSDHQPAGLTKACFYTFAFALPVAVSFLWLFKRCDKRFYTPDGAKGPFSYAGGFVFAGEMGNQEARLSVATRTPRSSVSVYSHDSRRRSSLSLSSHMRAERLEKLEKRISWGGISLPEMVHQALADDFQTGVPDPIWHDDCTAEDVAVDGAEKQMGWDAKSGKWAVRPISSMHKSSGRPASIISTVSAMSAAAPLPGTAEYPAAVELAAISIRSP